MVFMVCVRVSALFVSDCVLYGMLLLGRCLCLWFMCMSVSFVIDCDVVGFVFVVMLLRVCACVCYNVCVVCELLCGRVRVECVVCL